MVYKLNDTEKVKRFFNGWQDSLIWSCLQKVMGDIYVTDIDNPRSALAFLGCFGFFAGEPERELVENKPDGFVILTPQNEEWARLIEECFPSAERVIRYAIKKGPKFDRKVLQRYAETIPDGYELKEIDAELYDLCIKNPVTADFVSVFKTRENYLRLGKGMVILKNGEIVSGASSYTRYNEGIEIEVDTVKDERKKGLAAAACSALIIKCLDEGLYPSWDAQNLISVHLAEKLGYEFDHEYAVYEISSES